MKVFGPNEFKELLETDLLRDSLTIAGMVQKSEDPSVLLFDIGSSCTNWVKIPFEMIEEDGIRWYGKIPCQDHSHDYVELSLKWPSEPDSAVFAELLKHAVTSDSQHLTHFIQQNGN